MDWDAEYRAWETTVINDTDADGNGTPDVLDDAYEIENDDARLQAIRDAGPTGTYPECDGGAFPTSPPVLSRSLGTLVPFLPVFVLIPVLLPVLSTGWAASPHCRRFWQRSCSGSSYLGDGLLDWAVVTMGIIAACIPTPVKGLLSALSHLGALALWPTMMLAYHGTTGEINGEVAAPVLTVMDFLVWLLPFGVLMMVPIRWRMRDNEALI